MATTGRIQVSPGQTIQSAAWGNPVWDQSVQCFDTAAARDTQYPSPHPGSLCWTADTGTLWLRQASAWVPLTLGTRSASQAVSSQAMGAAFSPPTLSGLWTTSGGQMTMALSGLYSFAVECLRGTSPAFVLWLTRGADKFSSGVAVAIGGGDTNLRASVGVVTFVAAGTVCYFQATSQGAAGNVDGAMTVAWLGAA